MLHDVTVVERSETLLNESILVKTWSPWGSHGGNGPSSSFIPWRSKETFTPLSLYPESWGTGYEKYLNLFKFAVRFAYAAVSCSFRTAQSASAGNSLLLLDIQFYTVHCEIVIVWLRRQWWVLARISPLRASYRGLYIFSKIHILC